MVSCSWGVWGQRSESRDVNQAKRGVGSAVLTGFWLAVEWRRILAVRPERLLEALLLLLLLS
jgi:hypothetical protein